MFGENRSNSRHRSGSSAESLFATLLTGRIASLLLEAVAPETCHLVGGVLRDHLLGLPPRDFDAVVAGQGGRVAERLAATLPARLVPVGGERFAAFRLVGAGLTVDIWDRREETLEADLARRDLTINSIALDLRSGRVIDPLAGLADLEERRLRAASPTAFRQDPLRVLRLARFAGQLADFTVDRETLRQAGADAERIREAASERLRDELRLIFGQPSLAPAMEVLIRTGVYPGLWLLRPGEGLSPGPMRSSLRILERLVPAARELVAREQGIGELDLGAARQALAFRLCAASGMGEEGELVDAWRRAGYLTRRDALTLGRVLEWQRLPRDEPEYRWFLHRSGRLWPSALCLLGACASRQERERWDDLLAELWRLERSLGEDLFRPSPLLTVNEVRSLLGPLEGPRLGAVMRSLKRRQIEGRLRNREEALAFLAELREQTARGPRP